MTSWNETHYARAQEFTRLLSAALADAQSAAPAAPAIERTAPPFARPTAPLAAPLPPAPPAAATTPPPPSPAPATGATAASVFKKIPWKK